MASSQTKKRTTAGKRKTPARTAAARRTTSAAATPPASAANPDPAHEATDPKAATTQSDTPAETEAAHLAAAAQPAGSQPLKKGELLDAVKDGSSMSRGDLKAAMEAMLDQIGRALDEGREVVLPPFGKISVKKRKTAPNGDILTTRIKRHGGKSSTSDPAEG